MGAWVFASVFYALLLLLEDATGNHFLVQHTPLRLVRQTQGFDVTNSLLIGGGIHSAVSSHDNPDASATTALKFNSEDGGNAIPIPYNAYDYGQVGSYEADGRYKEFASIEAEAEGYSNGNEYLDTTGYNHYRTGTSFNLEGPKQLETITTQSFHKEVEPYDTSGFQKSNNDHHADVHYHQHKHLHKHSHKQEHVHKHQQDHKHDHDHHHGHHAQHEHKHDSQHKHVHNSEHKHNHKGEHHHGHHQEHKHSHQAQHKHGHKHRQEHKHDHHHGHKHSHHQEHKHSHHQKHKHDHHHGHKHESQHKHKHEHYGQHKHNHGHKDEHKHQRSHYHKYPYHKY